jgi:hypothetical protein
MKIPAFESANIPPIGEDSEALTSDEIKEYVAALRDLAQRQRRDATEAWRSGRRMFWGILVFLIGVVMWGSLFVADSWFNGWGGYWLWLVNPHYLGLFVSVVGIGMIIDARNDRRSARWHEKTAAEYERIVAEQISFPTGLSRCEGPGKRIRYLGWTRQPIRLFSWKVLINQAEAREALFTLGGYTVFLIVLALVAPG